MEILKFEGAPQSAPKARKKSSNMKTLAGLASVAAIAVLGSTLAANITLGAGSLEFGQGVQVTAACDSSITVTPQATFVNAADGGVFMLSTIGFSGFDNRTNATTGTTLGCQGKTFLVNAYGDATATPLQLATSGSDAVTQATFSLTAAAGTSTAGTVIAGAIGDTATETFDLGLTIPSSTSGAVFKLTLQSQ